MNVVYHNLINNSHSIINQSKLHHFHLYSSSFFCFCCFAASGKLWVLGLWGLVIWIWILDFGFRCRLIYGDQFKLELPRLGGLMKFAASVQRFAFIDLFSKGIIYYRQLIGAWIYLTQKIAKIQNQNCNLQPPVDAAHTLCCDPHNDNRIETRR